MSNFFKKIKVKKSKFRRIKCNISTARMVYFWEIEPHQEFVQPGMFMNIGPYELITKKSVLALIYGRNNSVNITEFICSTLEYYL